MAVGIVERSATAAISSAACRNGSRSVRSGGPPASSPGRTLRRGKTCRRRPGRLVQRDDAGVLELGGAAGLAQEPVHVLGRGDGLLGHGPSESFTGIPTYHASEYPADGAAAIAKAKVVGAKTQRERDYVDALGAMYADFDKVDRGARMQNYTKAMEQLAQRYPKDNEAPIYYALRAQHLGVAGRQDLRQPAQGCRHPGADRETPATASRRGALSQFISTTIR